MAVSASIPSAKLTTLLKGKPKISSLVEMVAIDPQSIMKKLGDENPKQKGPLFVPLCQ